MINREILESVESGLAACNKWNLQEFQIAKNRDDNWVWYRIDVDTDTDYVFKATDTIPYILEQLEKAGLDVYN